jgi:site-specific recombinase XerD
MIAPLERLQLPTHLDGSMLPRGSPIFGFRIEARNDLEAIQMWLAEVAKSEASFRSYRLEAERCLLWATMERSKPMTALNDEDIRDYKRFLLDPQPRERWLYAGIARREDHSWRPLRGPLSPRSCDRALGIISSLFEWLETCGYLAANPWHGPALASRSIDRKNTAPATMLERRTSIATVVDWSYVRKALDELETSGDEDFDLRTRTILYLAYFADMKPGEICSLRTSSIGVLASGPTSVWKLDIESRPPNIREIILLPPVQKALEQYFATRGITGGAGLPEADSPVIASSRDMHDWTEIEANLAGLGARSSTRQVFLRAAELAGAGGDNTAARRLSAATIHWLKHAFEIHTVQMNTSRNWCWHLLGACWLATPFFRTYLPARTPLSAETCLEAFEDLRSMWQDTSDWTGP